MSDIPGVVLSAQHRVHVPGDRGYRADRAQGDRGSPGPARTGIRGARYALLSGARAVDAPAVDNSAAAVRSCSTHSRCTSFSTLVAMKPDGP